MSQPPTLSVDPKSLTSRLQVMCGRDPHESGRVASTLELLFDLTFVVAVATSASELAHAVAHGHAGLGIPAFLFTSFGIIWAWVNYSWFASAYDTDDWLYRLMTMAQTIGVVIFTLGIPQMFKALVEHHELDNMVIVIGYVIMRVAMLCQWVRAYRGDPAHRRGIVTYATTLSIAQVLWLATPFLKNLHIPLGMCFLITTLITGVELAGPILAERGEGTPWHAHHIVERHGLLTIITIGEVITGTVLTLEGIVGDDARSINWTSTVLVAISGVGLAFGMWWSYFITPFAEVLHRFRERSFGFGYSHFIIWPSIAAVGGGLHVMALTFEDGDLHVDHTVAALALALPVGGFTIGLYLAHYFTTRFWAGLHTVVLTATVAVLALAVALASMHASLPVVLAIVTVVPWITVAAFELHDGSKHEAEILERLYVFDAANESH